MDVTELAARTVTALREAPQDTANGPLDAVLHVVTRKLGDTTTGARLLRRFSSEPEDETVNAEMRHAIASEAERDEMFARTLTDALAALDQPSFAPVDGDGSLHHSVPGVGAAQGTMPGFGPMGPPPYVQPPARRSRKVGPGLVITAVFGALLVAGGVALAVGSSEGPFADVEGEWYFRGSSSNAKLTIEDSGAFRLDTLTLGGQVQCSGSLHERGERQYWLDVVSGICTDALGTLSASGDVLSVGGVDFNRLS